ncbi:MAG: type I secretion system permease/ATPase [Rhodobacteraceae bacterium]|nr:type I secretion system permease/ATPase [Paracoccaceae bacterium]
MTTAKRATSQPDHIRVETRIARGAILQHLCEANRAPGLSPGPEARRILPVVVLFGIVQNLLLLTGPLYMLQVYDRVLVSRSEPTLVALTGLLVLAYAGMGVLEHARARLMVRLGARWMSRLDRRVFAAALSRQMAAPGDPAAWAAQRDLEAVQRFLASPAPLALFDLPWTVFFAGAIFLFHPWLGWLALAGGALLVALAALNQAVTARLAAVTATAAMAAEQLSDQIRQEAETVQGLGMRGAAFDRWQVARGAALAGQIALADRGGGILVLSRTARLILQSAMLGMGALVVLRGDMSGGAMIAGSVLLGRALQPVELVLAHWGLAQRARDGWRRLAGLLDQVPPEAPHHPLPKPRALLEVRQLTVIPPGSARAALRMVSFRLEPGQALGVIGPSGAGKSSLARALTGHWPAAADDIRLDGATLAQFAPDTLGTWIGYLPQRVALFAGTVAENIARLAPTPDSDQVVAAASRADAHRMIVSLPQGYDTPLGPGGAGLSGGQLQRIGLARALYGGPPVLVLDEPTANLDAEGAQALTAAVRQAKAAGGAVVLMTHHPAALQACDLVLVLDVGRATAFGPRDTVLRALRRPGADLVAGHGPGGAA